MRVMCQPEHPGIGQDPATPDGGGSVEPVDPGGPGGPGGPGLPGLPGGTPAELNATLAAARRGEEDAWRRIIELYGRRVFAMARSRCGRSDLAEEIAQSVFATIAIKLRQADGYSEQGRFEAWLFRITMNRVRDELRRLRRDAGATAGADAALELTANAAEPGAEPQELERLRTALNALGEADREVVELRHHAGLDFRRIAEVLDEPVGTVLARHHRALRKLRAILEDDSKGVSK